MTPRYPTVLFDWDGTLADTLTIWMNAYRTCFVHFGLDLTDAQIAGQLGAWDGVLSVGLPEEQRDAFWEAMRPEVEDHLPEAKLYEGALDLCNELKDAGVRLAVVTSSVREAIEAPVARYGLGDLFGAIVTADDVTHHKPHREPIDQALGLLGASTAGAVMIGDSVNDLGAANAAGTDSVLLHMPEHELVYDLAELEAHAPTHTAKTFAGLREILLG